MKLGRKKNKTKLDERLLYENRYRFLEEATHGVYALMEEQGRSRSWLAKQLGCSRAFVTKILEGTHNFTLETLADVYLALGRSIHLSFSDKFDQMKLPSLAETASVAPKTSTVLVQMKAPSDSVLKSPTRECSVTSTSSTGTGVMHA